jgi:hypothetical protein
MSTAAPGGSSGARTLIRNRDPKPRQAPPHRSTDFPTRAATGTLCARAAQFSRTPYLSSLTSRRGRIRRPGGYITERAKPVRPSNGTVHPSSARPRPLVCRCPIHAECRSSTLRRQHRKHGSQHRVAKPCRTVQLRQACVDLLCAPQSDVDVPVMVVPRTPGARTMVPRHMGR